MYCSDQVLNTVFPFLRTPILSVWHSLCFFTWEKTFGDAALESRVDFDNQLRTYSKSYVDKYNLTQSS